MGGTMLWPTWKLYANHQWTMLRVCAPATFLTVVLGVVCAALALKMPPATSMGCVILQRAAFVIRASLAMIVSRPANAADMAVASMGLTVMGRVSANTPILARIAARAAHQPPLGSALGTASAAGGSMALGCAPVAVSTGVRPVMASAKGGYPTLATATGSAVTAALATASVSASSLRSWDSSRGGYARTACTPTTEMIAKPYVTIATGVVTAVGARQAPASARVCVVPTAGIVRVIALGGSTTSATGMVRVMTAVMAAVAAHASRITGVRDARRIAPPGLMRPALATVHVSTAPMVMAPALASLDTAVKIVVLLVPV
mmetsp:Transcript_94937/g.163791  ORF Transcript_94937/g.163791 Transcript_94937/m.163791 type:complete len:318 (-) Transcript_94937:7689-8642(-)